jgi:predicted PurR-regulated permease PerM
VSRRQITPGRRARRALLVDALAAALLAALLLSLAAGLGVVAFLALPLFLAGTLWVAVERGIHRLRRRRRPTG